MSRDWDTAMRLLERLSNPKGDWHDDEARRLARQFVKRHKKKNVGSHVTESRKN